MRIFLTALVITLFACVGAIIGILSWAGQDLPSPEALGSIEPPVKTTILDCKGRVIQELYTQNRSPVTLDEVPKAFVDAIVSTEDRRFRSHWGIDLIGIGRAAVHNLMAGKIVEGGSTITQQLAWNLFLTHEKTLSRKIREAVLALRIERRYSKDEILEMYVNQIYFGDGTYGIASAARDFFGKSPSELTLAECALLAGLPRNPRDYSPRRHPDLAAKRRRLILKSMLDTGDITEEQMREASEEPVEVLPKGSDGRKAPYFVEMVRQYLDENYGSRQVYEAGYVVETTLDLDLQETAERALEEHLADIERQTHRKVTKASYDTSAVKDGERLTVTPYLQGAVVAMDPATGFVKVMIGGRDFNDSNFNRAVQAYRQAGSAFKPFTYAAAIDAGYTPSDLLLDAPLVMELPTGQEWVPANFDQEFRGPVTLREALSHSINIPAIRLLTRLGASTVADYAHRMGIHSPIPAVPSIALGTPEVSLIDLTSAYTVFANMGIRVEPVSVLRVTDRNGIVLEENGTVSEDVLGAQTAYLVTTMLESAVDEGTGRRARAMGLKGPAAGKTGTYDDYTDAWFVGFIPNLVAGVWVGYDVKRPIGGKSIGQGSAAALPVWTELMLAASEGSKEEAFRCPRGIVSRRICKTTGLLATDRCPETRMEVFKEGTEPVEACYLHRRSRAFDDRLGDTDFRAIDRQHSARFDRDVW
jgi:penicillin-binding protein 1A